MSRSNMGESRRSATSQAQPEQAGAPLRPLLDRDCLLLAIEGSVKVRSRTQFFSWVQGALQAILPHEMLLYAAYDREGALALTDVMTVRQLADEGKHAWLRPDGGLLAQLMVVWNRRGKNPVVLDLTEVDECLERAPGVLLVDGRPGRVAAHGVLAVDGSLDSFFAFTDVSPASAEEVELVVDLILPSLRAALVRTQVHAASAQGVGRHGVLTARERQVLHLLRNGRSNAEIGASLSISPLTVKNHVQKLLRKLGVRNRTQAVAMEAARAWRAET